MPLFGDSSPTTIIYPTATPKVVIATAIGLSLSAFFTGSGYALTYVALPSLLLPPPPPSAGLPVPTTSPDSDTPKAGTAPAHLARQWQTIYRLGSSSLPIATIGSAAALVYAMLQLPKNLQTQRTLLATAAVLAVSVGPFTALVMKGTNNELHLRADAATSDGEDEEAHPENATMGEAYQTQGLIKYWGGLNLMRATLPLAGIVCAVTALVW